MNEPLLILGMFVVTFGARYLPVALLGRRELPRGFFRTLSYVPPAVLTAIIVPEMLYQGVDGTLYLSFRNSFLVAGLFAMLVAWRTRNLLLTIGLGMAFFLLWKALVGG